MVIHSICFLNEYAFNKALVMFLLMFFFPPHHFKNMRCSQELFCTFKHFDFCLAFQWTV